MEDQSKAQQCTHEHEDHATADQSWGQRAILRLVLLFSFIPAFHLVIHMVCWLLGVPCP